MQYIENVAVIGAGFMGASIALLCAQHGIHVVNVDLSKEQIEKAKESAEKKMAKSVAKGLFEKDDAEAILGKIDYSTDIINIKQADVVVEAVSEEMALKHQVIAQIEKNTGEDVIILSNTSGLSITEIACNSCRPEAIIGAHFFSPPTVMNLVELIRGKKTSDKTFDKTISLIERLGKTPVTAPELPGFIVNRLLIPMINDAAFLLMQGAKKEDIDAAMKLGANHKMGPLELGDYIGLDVVLAIMQTLHKGFADEKYRPCPLIVDMVLKGKLGRKTQEGFYVYDLRKVVV